MFLWKGFGGKAYLSYEDMDGFWGAATFTEAMNAVCQIRYYEDNVKILASKFTQLTTKAGLMTAIKSYNDEGLRPYLMNQIGGKNSLNGGFGSRLYMVSRLLGVGPEKIHASAALFSTINTLLNKADPDMMITEGLQLYVNNMLDLNSEMYGSFVAQVGNKGALLHLKSTSKTIEEDAMRKALANVQYKFINKIRMVLYVIDKFVRLERVKKARKQMLDELMADALTEAKAETWKDTIKKRSGSVAVAANGVAVLAVSQATGTDKAEGLFGNVGVLTGNLFRSRFHDLQRQDVNVLNAIQSVN
jgi:hypothetical protein